MALTLEAIQARMDELNGELEELKTARRVLLRFEGTPAAPIASLPSQANGHMGGRIWSLDLAGKTIMECARSILAETTEEGMHFSEIAQRARKRGYNSGRVTSDPEKSIRQSFWATLSRNSDFFRPLGKGRFCLTERGMAAHNAHHARTLLDEV